MPKVVRTPQANRDLLAIWSYVAEDSSEAADRLLDTIASTCDTVAIFPGLGRSRAELAPSLRSIPVGSYVIFYRAVEDGIEVIRVLHGARDLDRHFPS